MRAAPVDDARVVHRITTAVISGLWTAGDHGVDAASRLYAGADAGLSTIHSPYYCYYLVHQHPTMGEGSPVKFRCEREILAEALATAGRAATGRTGTLPVLSGLRLELAGDQLTVTGTDLDLTIQLELTVGGDDRRRRRCCRPGSRPTSSARCGAGKVEVVGRRRRGQHQRRPLAVQRPSAVARRLPAPRRRRRPSAVTLDAAAFGEALRQVVRAASTDEARPILTGVLLTAENDGLRLVATDSYRLAVRDLPGVSVLGAGPEGARARAVR